MVSRHGGMEYAREKMGRLAAMAVDDLSALPESPAKEALKDLVEYNMGRTV